MGKGDETARGLEEGDWDLAEDERGKSTGGVEDKGGVDTAGENEAGGETHG